MLIDEIFLEASILVTGLTRQSGFEIHAGSRGNHDISTLTVRLYQTFHGPKLRTYELRQPPRLSPCPGALVMVTGSHCDGGKASRSGGEPGRKVSGEIVEGFPNLLQTALL